ncbi:MAG: ribosomal protein S18-alanine N-acetyltransferase [Thermodesulfovibrionales bacterium]
MRGIFIRHMHRDHLPEVIEIERSSFSTPWSEISFMNEIYDPRAGAFVALEGSAVAGYIVTKSAADEGHILNLAVRGDLRRRGIAAALVRKGLEHLKKAGARYVYLEVRASNAAAISLYEGFGFRAGGIRKSYYLEPREDALIMVLELE